MIILEVTQMAINQDLMTNLKSKYFAIPNILIKIDQNLKLQSLKNR